jgi:hypothetical protein
VSDKVVGVFDDWDKAVVFDEEIGGERVFGYSGKGSRFTNGDYFEVLNSHLRVDMSRREWVQNAQAVSELKALMDEWRGRGWSAEVIAVEDTVHLIEDGDSVYDNLGETKEEIVSRRFPLAGCKFYVTDPNAPPSYWGAMLKASIDLPVGSLYGFNARIVNLSASGLGADYAETADKIREQKEAPENFWTCTRGCGYELNGKDRATCEVCGRGKGD